MPAVDTGIYNSSSQSRTQVCPINDLPYDVFYLLLFTCWEEAQRSYWGRRTHFPTIASHVCRTWRQHAIDTPSFWAKLTFRSKILQLDKYQEWLTRLRGAPFDVYIGQEPFTSASIKRAKGIMRLIMPHISHLRSFQVSYVPTKILRLIFDRLNDANAPLLQRLRVEKRSRTVHGDLYDPRRNRWEPRPFYQGQAPNLEQVHLSGISYGYIMDRFGATLNTFIISPITNLVTPHNYAKIAQDILSRAPNLRVFGFLINPFNRDTADQWIQTFQSPPLPSVTHSSLEELYIGGDRRDWDVIVCSLVLPQIRYFADRHAKELEFGLCCLPTIALGPFPNLVILRLEGSRNPWSRQGYTRDPLNSPNLAHLRNALQGLTELQELMFKRVDFEDHQYLMQCLGTAGYCPRLGRLELLWCVGYTMRELREVVEARRQSKSIYPLNRITVHDWPVSNHRNQEDAEARDWLTRVVDLREESDGYLGSVKGVGLSHFRDMYWE